MNSIYPRFAILRHLRVKHLSQVKPKGQQKETDAVGRWKHYLRLIRTVNADSERYSLNSIVCSETDWIPQSWDWIPLGYEDPPWLNSEYLAQKTRSLIEERSIKSIRKDATYLEDMLLSVSPHWFRDGDLRNPLNPTRVLMWKSAVKDYLISKYGENLVAIIFHFDEQTPHVGAFVFPAMKVVITQRGMLKEGATRSRRVGWKLCAATMFHSRQCSKNQSDYAAFLQSRGLDIQRGIEGSRSTYVTMDLQRKLLNAPTPELPSVSFPTEEEVASRLKPGQTHLQYVVEDYASKYAAMKELIAEMHAKAVDRDQAVKKKIEYQLTASDIQQKLQGLQEQIRPVSVLEALRRLLGSAGAKNESYEIFHAPVGRTLAVSLKDDTFQTGWSAADVDAAKVQRGAVAAICLATELPHEWAMWWLAKQFGTNRAGATMAAATPLYLSNDNPILAGVATVREESIVHSAEAWPKLRLEIEEKYGLPGSYLQERADRA